MHDMTVRPSRFSLALLLLLGVQTLLLAGTAIKFATVAPRNSTWMNQMEAMNEELQEASGGDLRFKFYPGGVQGDEKDVIRKMRIGQLHAGGFTGVGLGLIQPDARVLDLPYLFRDSDEADLILEEMFDDFAGRFEKKGYILLGWAEVGFVHFFTKKPVRSLDDLKSQKMWIWEGDPLAKAYFDALNLHPVPLALPDVLTSFQTGLINAAYASPYGASVLQWQSRVSFISERPMANASGAVLMTKAAFKKLSPEHQTILRDVSRRHLRALTQVSRVDNQAALQAFVKAGIEIVPPASQEEAAHFESLGVDVQDQLAGSLFDAQLLQRVRDLLQAHRDASSSSSE
jgi:TRAP-type transport system periplasmic protein